jgi:hypothetical protein
MVNEPFSGSAWPCARAVEAGVLVAEGAALLGDVGVFTPPPLHPAASTHTNRQTRFIATSWNIRTSCRRSVHDEARRSKR